MVDPPMMTKEILERSMQRSSPLIGVIELAKHRKDIWPSRAAAREWLATRMPWRRWSPEVLDLYVVRAVVVAQPLREVNCPYMFFILSLSPGTRASRAPDGDVPGSQGGRDPVLHARARVGGLRLPPGRHRQSRAAERALSRHTRALHLRWQVGPGVSVSPKAVSLAPLLIRFFFFFVLDRQCRGDAAGDRGRERRAQDGDHHQGRRRWTSGTFPANA